MGGERLQSLQAVRGLAFIMIFLSHVELTATGPMGVSIFLVLSGFCMTYAYLDKPEKTPTPGFVNNLKFSWKKVKKLYPLHIVTLLFIAFIVFAELALHKASGEELLQQTGYFIANGLLIQSWISWREGYFSFNAVSWYLSTATFSYFLFPWIFRIIQSKDKKRITRFVGFMIGLMVVIAIILGIGREYCGLTRDIIKWGVYICPLYRAGDFILGLVIGYFFVTIKNSGGGEGKTVYCCRSRCYSADGRASCNLWYLQWSYKLDINLILASNEFDLCLSLRP